MIAKDLMNVQVPHLNFDTTVLEAVSYFEAHTTDFVVVMASADRLQGVLTEGGLVKAFFRHLSQPTKDHLIFHRDCFEPPQLVHEREEFGEIVKKIMGAVGNRVFVINDTGAMTGYISARDILPVLSGKKNHPKIAGPAFDELKSQLYLYESFFSKSPFMMHSVNPQGFIQMANEMLHLFLGYEYGELLGKTIYDIYPKVNHEKAEKGIETILSKGYHQVITAQMVTKSGSQVEVELASRALVDPWKNPVGTITVSRPLDMKVMLELQKFHPG